MAEGTVEVGSFEGGPECCICGIHFSGDLALLFLGQRLIRGLTGRGQKGQRNSALQLTGN